MVREMTERVMDLLDETHQKNVFVQGDGRIMCRQCHDTWPCDTRLLVDSHKRLGALLNTIGQLNMKAFGLVAEAVEHVKALDAQVEMDRGPSGDDPEDPIRKFLADAEEYLEIGMPK